MNFFDLPLDELKVYRPLIQKEKDFDSFWEKRITESCNQPLNSACDYSEAKIDGVVSYDFSYDGFRNSRIHGRLFTKDSGGENPLLVMFHGYNWNNLRVTDALPYLFIGYSVLVMDLRGQSPASPDHNLYPNGGPAGWMTKGIFDKNEYYYLFAFMDGVRAIEAVSSLEFVDDRYIYTEGGSQGGGMSLAVAALSEKVCGAMADIPFLCHYSRSYELGQATPYGEIAHYFEIFDQLHSREAEIYTTLSYFDNVNLADKINCPVLLSTGLQDTVCPPSSVFAAYNNINSQKKILVFPEFGHGGFNEHMLKKIEFLSGKMEFE